MGRRGRSGKEREEVEGEGGGGRRGRRGKEREEEKGEGRGERRGRRGKEREEGEERRRREEGMNELTTLKLSAGTAAHLCLHVVCFMWADIAMSTLCHNSVSKHFSCQNTR